MHAVGNLDPSPNSVVPEACMSATILPIDIGPFNSVLYWYHVVGHAAA